MIAIDNAYKLVLKFVAVYAASNKGKIILYLSWFP